MDMRVIKDKEEIELMKESCRWGNFAHKLLQDYTYVGGSEIEVVNEACSEASRAMLKALEVQISNLMAEYDAYAGYRGQIGKGSAIPHATTGNNYFRKGDTLVTGASANVYNYKSELERTMFMGEPSKDQEKYFAIMLKLKTLL